MPRNTARSTAALLNATAAASASVIAARMLAFSNPATVLSSWHQSEAQRMSSEKLAAARDGAFSAGMELCMMPARLLQLGARPASWTPAGWMGAWMEGANLWLGVGNAALRAASAYRVLRRSLLPLRPR
jgi:hypothetical protein